MKKSTLFKCILFGMLFSITGLVSTYGDVLSSEKEITYFAFLDLDPEAIGEINQSTNRINVTVHHTATLNNLVAHFLSSEGSTVSVGTTEQDSGVTVNDFTNPLTYRVEAEDGTTVDYIVTVTKAAARTGKSMLSFGFDINPAVDGDIDQSSRDIDVEVHHSTDLTNLKAVFTSSVLSTVKVGAVVQESGVTVNDFTAPVTYTVVAEDGSENDYTVTVTKADARNDKRMLSFSFEGLDPAVDGEINQTAFTISLTVPFSTDLSGLIATFTHSDLSTVSVGAVVQESGVTVNDFTDPVAYSVEAEDGSTEIYTVTVNKAAASSAKELLSFDFEDLDPDVEGDINPTAHTVSLLVPYSTDLTTLVASFEVSPNATVKIGEVIQESGITVNDFSDPVIYLVEAEDETSVAYTVTVNKEAVSTNKRITSFKFAGLDPEVTGSINEASGIISATVPFGTDLTDLVATFTNSRLSTVSVGGVVQESGVTSNDYSSTVAYKVTAEDESTRYYNVIVTEADGSNYKRLLSFEFADLDPVVIGSINETLHTVSATIPFSADIENLVATFTSSAYSTVKVGAVVQESGTTVNDFSDPVTYTIVAQDGTTQDYDVSVTKAPASSENSFLSFSFNDFDPDAEGTINEETKTISVVVPFSADITTLVASFEVSPLAYVKIGEVIQEEGITANDFTDAVQYKVVAENGATEIYTVTVTKADVSTAKQLLSFKFEGTTPKVVGVIDQDLLTVSLTCHLDTDISDLIATFEISPLATAKIGTVVQTSGVSVNDYTDPVTYTIVAEDGSEREYLVTVALSDIIPPVVTMANQTTNNLAGSYVVAKSSELSGRIFIIREGEAHETWNDFITAEEANLAASVNVTQADHDLPINTYELHGGTYWAYAFDNSLNRSGKSTGKVLVQDLIKPVITMEAQEVHNGPSQSVLAQSNELGKIFIVHEDADQDNILDLLDAVAIHEAAFAVVGSVDTDISVSTQLLEPGTYNGYAVDTSDNISIAGENVITVREASREKSISRFAFDALDPVVEGEIVGTSISLDVPPGTDLTSLVASYMVSRGATVMIGSTVQESGVTPNNFTNPINYIVMAEDGTTLTYYVRVTVGLSVGKTDIENIGLYPNPAQTDIRISNALQVKRIEIYNMLGEQVKEVKVYQESEIRIDLQDLTKGLYFANIYGERGFIGTKKLIKE